MKNFSADMLIDAAEETKLQLVEVAIPLAVDDPYTYAVPAEWSDKIKPGVRVRIPFKNRDIVGYIVGFSDSERNAKTKSVLEVLDEKPLVSQHFLELTQWIKSYYFSSWGEAIQACVPKQYRKAKIAKKRKKKAELPENTAPSKKTKEFTLTGEQQDALNQIIELMRTSRFNEALLLGVTGSGKSELYIRAIQHALRNGKSAICLVPEIALTEQIERFFEGYFGDELEIIHSKLSDGERWQAWDRIRRGEKKVVLGVRSAIFSPLENLGLIIIDEEQEPSYKQDQTPRYHARDVARWRAQNLGALLLMGSATPSIELLHEARTGNIHLLELSKRIGDKELPQIQIIDLKQAQQISREKVIISSTLAQAVQSALEKKESVMLMLNRRGFSTQAQCLQCGKAIACRHCDVALTFHQAEQKLLCHYCNYSIGESDRCVYCQYQLFRYMGVGTEKVESEIARMFPQAKVARLDSDVIRKKGSHEDILSRFRAREIDILVGTQMIAKGFDFPHVTLVGIILADTALLLPDYRSSEKTFQLVTQMAGRSGRGELGGKVLVQTFSPFHYSIQSAKNHDTKGFYEQELKHRQDFSYPPFVKLINIIIRSKIEKRVIEQAEILKSEILKVLPIHQTEVLGPAPLPFYRLRGHFRWHLMIKIKNQTEQPLLLLKKALQASKKVSKVFMLVDTDPVSIL